MEVVGTGDLPQQPALTLRTARIERVLGLPMSQERSQAILEGLGFAVTPRVQTPCIVSVPAGVSIWPRKLT